MWLRQAADATKMCQFEKIKRIHLSRDDIIPSNKLHAETFSVCLAFS